ncbi:MAG: GGDEF domain-containing protein, partial [Rhodocyclaceae bacterium]|nr:GGDEF domain-containing protein [Rhodocyclaceae bacterium]
IIFFAHPPGFAMVKIPLQELVGKIAALTDHRDIDMLEVSLLRTVNEMLSPAWAAIYHVSKDEPPQFAVSISGETLSHDAPEKTFSTLASTAGVTSFSIISQGRDVIAYLLIEREAELSAAEHQTLCGLFRIYDNYLSVLKDSQIDRLTGLLNRHTFDFQLEKALNLIRAAYRDEKMGLRRRKETGAFFVGEIDIDHFKRINDSFGHLYGDEVLIIIARILQSTFRKTDLIYRFGGEEFIVIVYVDNAADAEMTFERLRRTVENHAFPQVEKVTVSIGVTRITDSSMPIELLGHADQALYYAKQHGRNQVCFYETLLAEGKLRPHRSNTDVTLFESEKESS